MKWRASFIWTVNFKQLQEVEFYSIKGALSSLRQVLATESPLKVMKNSFSIYFNFCLEFSVISKNGLKKNISADVKPM